MRDKVVAITGAASGIGRALAIELAARGAHVALADMDEAGLSATCGALSSSARVSSHVVDVRDFSQVSRFAREASEAHGGVDVIINNAGMTVYAVFEEMLEEDFKRVVDVNFWGVVNGVRAFLPLLRLRPAGHVVNIASVNALVPFAKNSAYNASKNAVLGFTETLMQELSGSNVGVSCVVPGGIRTNIARSAKGFSAEEVELFERVAGTSPEAAARTIIRGIERQRKHVYIGMDSRLLAFSKRLLPGLTVRLFGVISMNPERWTMLLPDWRAR